MKMQSELIVESKNELGYRFLERVKELKPSINGLITFPPLFQYVCGSLWITKQECWKLMFEARDASLIEIVPFHGIKIK